jgi:hypothetical protein
VNDTVHQDTVHQDTVHQAGAGQIITRDAPFEDLDQTSSQREELLA